MNQTITNSVLNTSPRRNIVLGGNLCGITYTEEIGNIPQCKHQNISRSQNKVRDKIESQTLGYP